MWIGNPKLQRDAGTDMEEIAVLFHRLLCVSPKGKYPDAQVFMKIKQIQPCYGYKTFRSGI